MRIKGSPTIDISVRGKRWKIKFVDPHWLMEFAKEDEPLHGYVRYDLKTIFVSLGLTKEETAETILHEVFHAGGFDFDEVATEGIARAQKNALKKLNWLENMP